MAMGKTHDRFNLTVGMMAVGACWMFRMRPLYLWCFSAGWFISTYIFSPDTDLGPKKRVGLLGVFLYPYSLIFKHRGMSHGPLLGTVTRLMYLLALTVVCRPLWQESTGAATGGLRESIIWSGQHMERLVKDFDLNRPSDLALVWLILGIFLADLTHILLDKFTTLIKKVF